MLIRILALALVAAASAGAQQAPDHSRAIVKSYLEIHAQLASDNLEQAKAPARTLASEAAALGKDGAEMAKAATALANATDIKAAREAFGTLSEQVIARVTAEESKGAAADLRLAYCPMVKRSWLQRGNEVKNPYYGSTMLTCGELKPLK